MKFGTWFEEKLKASGKPRREFLEELAKEAGVNWNTLDGAVRGARLGNYKKAMQVSVITGYKVSVLELCDENPAATLKIINQHDV